MVNQNDQQDIHGWLLGGYKDFSNIIKVAESLPITSINTGEILPASVWPAWVAVLAPEVLHHAIPVLYRLHGLKQYLPVLGHKTVLKMLAENPTAINVKIINATALTSARLPLPQESMEEWIRAEKMKYL